MNENVQIIPLTLELIEQAAHPWPDRWEEQLGRLRWHLSTPYAIALMAEIFGDVIGVACGLSPKQARSLASCPSHSRASAIGRQRLKSRFARPGRPLTPT